MLPSKVTLAGAGLCGPLMPIRLARRGFEMEVYERRDGLLGEPAEPLSSIGC